MEMIKSHGSYRHGKNIFRLFSDVFRIVLSGIENQKRSFFDSFSKNKKYRVGMNTVFYFTMQPNKLLENEQVAI